MKRYQDMLALPHPESPRRRKLSRSQRAAQFMPFAALTGYEELVAEEARLTQAQRELDETEKERLDRQLQWVGLELQQGRQPLLLLTYFQPDAHKEGGRELVLQEQAVKLDTFRKRILLKSGKWVPIKRILELKLGALNEKIPAGTL